MIPMHNLCKTGLELFVIFLMTGASIARGIEFEGIKPANPITRDEFEARIKASYGFLSAREPKLDRAEYAILEKFIPYLELDPGFALTMIEGLTKNNENLTATFDYLLGNLYVQSGQLENAEKAYKNAINKHPDFLRAWKAIGLLYMNSEDLVNSMKALGKCIQLGDTDPITFGQIGYCFIAKNDYLSALSAYSQAILYEPGKVDWMLGKVTALKGLSEYEQANVILREIVRHSPDNSQFWMELANNWVRMGKPLKAAACLEFLREGGLQTRASMEMLGTIYMNESMELLAFGVYKSMIETGIPPDGSSLLRCARNLHKNGKGPEAEFLVGRFLDTSPKLDTSDEAAILRYQSQVLEQEQKYEEADNLISKALAIKPDDAAAMIAKGRIAYHLGNTEEALTTLAQAGYFSGYSSESAVLQAQILVAGKEYKKAEKMLHEALLNGGDVWVEQFYDEVRLQARKAELDRLADAQFLQRY